MSQVHYVAYGSNLAAARFDCYLRGGRPPGATTDYPGCVDQGAAGGPRPVEIGHELAFGRWSPRWEGGVAFVDPRLGSGRALGAAWLISWAQLGDVCAQECGQRRAAPAEESAVEELAGCLAAGELSPGETFRLRDHGWYAEALVLEPIEGLPAVTLTGSLSADDLRPPAPAYLAHVRAGLAEVWGLDEAAIDAYLAPVLADARRSSGVSRVVRARPGRSRRGRRGRPGW